MRPNTRRRLLIILGVAAGIVLLGRAHKLGPLQGAADVIGRPVAVPLRGVGNSIGNAAAVVTTARHLASDNAQLRQQNADLRASLAQYADQQAQLDAIKKELSIKDLPSRRLIPAEVTSYAPDNYRAFVTINRGSSDGLRAGMPVLSGGSLVGKLSDVNASSSKVFLITDPEFTVGAQVGSGDTQATGLVHGQLGGGLVMERIPQDQTVKPGDLVATSGLSGDIIKGYSIGVVQTVTRQDNGVFQTAVVKSSVRFNALQTLFVVGN